MKYWEIIACNLGKSGWSWGCVLALDCEERTICIVDAHRDGKRFVVRTFNRKPVKQGIYLAFPWANRSTACCNALMAARRRSHRSVPLIERNRALELRGTRAMHPGPRRHKAPTARAPTLLNSARRHCISPRRGRRVEWSDQRPGNVRLHFRARRSRRRRASDAGYKSVGNAGSIDVTTTDISLRTDSVQRCKG